jgi:hypothetical protein
MTMMLPAPSRLLRHRPPALLLGTVETHTGRSLACAGIDAGPWPWPRLLEGTAQAAGLLAGLQPGGPGNGAVIAEYRDVALGVERHRGRVRFEARLERRLAHFWRCRCEARAADGRMLLASRVTLAPGQDGAR